MKTKNTTTVINGVELSAEAQDYLIKLQETDNDLLNLELDILAGCIERLTRWSAALLSGEEIYLDAVDTLHISACYRICGKTLPN